MEGASGELRDSDSSLCAPGEDVSHVPLRPPMLRPANMGLPSAL